MSDISIDKEPNMKGFLLFNLFYLFLYFFLMMMIVANDDRAVS